MFLSSSETTFPRPVSLNENFVGWEGMLSQLLERLPPNTQPNACQRTVIEGLGGIGKTQVAIEAAYRFRESHPDCSVFWVLAVDMTMFEGAYREIGRALEIEGIEHDKADVKALVKKSLDRDEAGPWLLIVDNADDMLLLNEGQLMSHLPFSRDGSILFTTRNHHVAARVEARQGVHRLDQLSDSESERLLHRGLQPSQIDDAQSTTELLKYLVHLPLAIRQASAYMACRMNVTIENYLGYCTSSNQIMVKMLSKDFDDQDRYEEIRNPVATTWLISFEQISRDDPLAAGFLGFICYFEEKDIPVSLLPTGADEVQRDEEISTLRAYVFILDRGTPDRFDVHRLAHLVMRNWVRTQGKQSQQVTVIIQQLSKEFPPPKHENRSKWALYLPHVQAVLPLMDECSERERFVPSQSNVAYCYFLLGKYSKAEQIFMEVLEVMNITIGHGHIGTLRTMQNLACVLSEQGKYSEAEFQYREIFEMRKILQGHEHSDTIDSMNNLVAVLSGQGKNSEVETISWQALALRETVLGHDHPDTWHSMHSLALMLSDQGKYSEAEQMHREILALREARLGYKHPFALYSRGSHALELSHQGKQEAATQQQPKALKGFKKVLGEEHRRTLDCMYNLALYLYNVTVRLD
ncbi:hypothetical protein PG994_009782 [Apiospora phragmitis]|uniref:NB-ARC domain-containing protein n=1 Tax=Apiospora phragmitis TaxID=2905665 RepID=A0ABR1U774_9PEZI